jgi:hypothetical protein
MSSSNNTVVLSREEVHSNFHERVSDAFDSKSHKKRKIGCGHFSGIVRDVRSHSSNSLEDSLCDIIDNVEGKASVGNLNNIGCWVEMLYNEEKIYKLKVIDNLPNGFNGLDNEETNNPLNMTHIRDGHNDDKESSEFGTGLKKALVFIGNSYEIYTRSIENGTDICWYVKMDFVEMSQRKNPEDSYEATIMEKITYEKYRQYHNNDVGTTIIISDIRNDKICSYVNKNEFEQQLRDYLSLKFTGKLRMNIFKLYLNNTEIIQHTDVYTNNNNKFTFTFYINKRNIDDIVVNRQKHRGQTRSLRFFKETLKLKEDNENPVDISVYEQSKNYWKMVLTCVSTYGIEELSSILGKNITEIIRFGRNYGCVMITKVEQDGYSNYISNKVEYVSKGLNTYLGVSSHKKVTDLPKNSITSALCSALKYSTNDFRNDKKGKKGSSNSDDNSSVISDVSSVTSSSVASKKKSRVSKKTVLAMPQAPPPSNSNSNAIDISSSDEETNVNTIEVVVSSPLTEMAFTETAVELVETAVAETETVAVADNNLTGFGISVPVSATQRVNLAVKDGLEVMTQMLEKEDLVINMSGLNSLISMYLDGANSKTKLRILQQLVSEKYTPEDSNKHMLGGAELVRLSNAV